jgi:purine-nucleoside phosphorylase
MDPYLLKLEQAQSYILEQFDQRVDLGIILGTGLGGFHTSLDTIDLVLDYKDIPGFPLSTVEGHEGKFYIGRLGMLKVVVMSGRFHYYEGYSMKDIAFPVRLLKLMGAEYLIVTNVSGSVHERINQGDLVVIQDHINFMPGNPLRGVNLDLFGPRFPDFSEVYDSALIKITEQQAQKIHVNLKKGVYFGLQGPNLETPAEYRMIHRLGGDLVGMSTIPEIITAKHMGMRILAISLVVNKCYPLENIEETTIKSVLEVADKYGSELKNLVLMVLKDLEMKKSKQ